MTANRRRAGVYDEPSSALAQTLEAMVASYERFSFFQGLEADAEVPA